MFFNIKCYIQSINNNEIIVYINDNNELIRFQNNLIKLYKNIDSFDYEKKIYKIKLLSSTKYNISFQYNNLNALIGTNVNISGKSKYYCFVTHNEEFDTLTNLFKPIKKIIKGYTLYANKIYN
jgi:hypothetical protein